MSTRLVYVHVQEKRGTHSRGKENQDFGVLMETLFHDKGSER